MVNWLALDRIAERQREDPAFAELSAAYVAGEGPENPWVFVLGEAPGGVEDTRRSPFRGPAGIVLRQLIASVGLSDEGDCWITNVVKFRPPSNKTPNDKLIEAARPYLRREWRAVGQPKIIIAVGGVALRALFGTKRRISILKVAGKHIRIKGLDIWPMVHPSFGIRNPAIVPVLERDWDKLAEWLRAQNKRAD